MKLLTRNTDYGIRAICFMSKSGKRLVAVPELVKALRIPRPFLRKILQILSRNGIIISHRGTGGGFELGMSPRKILLLDVINIFQGPLRINECFFKKNLCPNVTSCVLKRKVDKIGRHILSELQSVTIYDLLKG